MRIEQLGALRARVTGGSDNNGGGDGPVVVLMHGFGAPGSDLVPLGAELAKNPDLANARFVFPEAPLEVDLGYGGYGEARAWWMIDLQHRIDLLEEGRLEELIREVPDGLPEARDKVISMLDHLEQRLGSIDRLVLGGFSQGGMVATDVALRIERKLSGLAILSGTLLNADEWTRLMQKKSGLHVFQSHGTRDPLLPFEFAKQLSEMFRSAGLDAEFVEFPGQHEIPRNVLTRLSAFLSKL